MNDRQFLKQFFDLTLPSENFNHQGHIRLAWLVCQNQSLPMAIETICNAIKNYAESLGASEKFHRTVTQALTMIIYHRQKAEHYDCFEDFIAKNSDLQNNAIELLGHYYSQSILKSDSARLEWIAPDKAKID